MARSVIEAIKDGLWDYEPEENGNENTKSTEALPGSDEKLEVLAQRLREGKPLWHPSDRLCFRDEED